MQEFNYTPEELKAMKNEYAKQATQAQFDLWIAECRNRGLVPVKDVVLQIRATKEWNPETRQKEFVKKAVHITTIQALRKLAERTGKYAGQLPSKWVYLDDSGNPSVESDVPLPDRDKVSPRRPWAAKASVVRKGFDHPITVPARFEAYAQYFSDGSGQQLNSTWANRGPEQLEKCAEALALRKAFPEELGGLYLQEEFTDEETVAATAQPSTESTQPQANPAAPEQANPVEPKKVRKKSEPKPDKRTDFPHGHNSPAPEEARAAQPAPPPSNAITPDNPITDADVPFPGDPEPDREPTELERKVFLDKLIALKNKGYTNLREWILKQTGVARTNDIGFNKMTELVARLESADKDGTLKTLLSN